MLRVNARERLLYELARKTGDRRFGSLCRHEDVSHGRCTNCLRGWDSNPRTPGYEPSGRPDCPSPRRGTDYSTTKSKEA